MNIKEAKEEVKNSIRAYLAKDASGAYMMEDIRRRPILLMGPPGIGKTAIMEQIARELKINLVSYTITHHTRQSAIGLPVVSEKVFDGKNYRVTEYTMSEIIASVYERIEESGNAEGILFLDEINCVSETLMPTMLQFLQYKMFGTHKVPRGFVIVCAGNPAKYNRAVRDFDIVTLDRLRRIDIKEDFESWKEYAGKARICGVIPAYLDIKKDAFYSIHEDIEEVRFVTARGWEDLSATIAMYEELSIPVTEAVVREFIQDDEIAADFALYYELYKKYRDRFKVDDILSGAFKEGGDEIANAPFDEKISLLHLLEDSCRNLFYAYHVCHEVQTVLYDEIGRFRDLIKRGDAPGDAWSHRVDVVKAEIRKNEMAGYADRDTLLAMGEAVEIMTAFGMTIKEENPGDARDAYRIVTVAFGKREDERMDMIETIRERLSHVFLFLDRTFGEGQEMVIFLTALSNGHFSRKFLQECGSVEYDKYSRVLLLKERKDELKTQIMQMGDFDET